MTQISPDLTVAAEIHGGRLELAAGGRLDAVSAPALLEFYEKTVQGNEISRIVIDCADLTYISSAGLRTLLIMYKSCSEGLGAENLNEDVADIMRASGFDRIFV